MNVCMHNIFSPPFPPLHIFVGKKFWWRFVYPQESTTKDEFSVPFGGFSPNSFVACSNVKNRWFPPKSLLDGSFVTVLKNDSSGGQSDGRIVCNTAFKYACKASFLSFTKAWSILRNHLFAGNSSGRGLDIFSLSCYSVIAREPKFI